MKLIVQKLLILWHAFILTKKRKKKKKKEKKKSPPAAHKISTIITLSNQAGRGLIRFRSQLPSDTVTLAGKQNKRIGAAVVLPPDPSRSH